MVVVLASTLTLLPSPPPLGRPQALSPTLTFLCSVQGSEQLHLSCTWQCASPPPPSPPLQTPPPPPPTPHTQALSPTLTFLRNGEGAEQLDAVTLLGSICEKRPGAAAFLVAEGALPPVAKLVATGGTKRVIAAAAAGQDSQNGVVGVGEWQGMEGGDVDGGG